MGLIYSTLSDLRPLPVEEKTIMDRKKKVEFVRQLHEKVFFGK